MHIEVPPMMPVTMMPRAIAADLSRAVIGPDHAAETARAVIARTIRIVAGSGIAIVARREVTVAMDVKAMAIIGRGVKAAAREGRSAIADAAAVKCRSA